MKRILYFDLVGGISGDMSVGALLDLGVDFNRLRRELKKIKVGGFTLKKRRLERGHVKATKFEVAVTKNRNYSYKEIIGLINRSRLTKEVKKNILKVFEALCVAETAVHGHRSKDIRFQQLGEIDSIVDIAAFCICLEELGITDIRYSAVPLNKGIAPATFKLLLNKNIYFTSMLFENVTPTGIAVLSCLGKQVVSLLKDTLKPLRLGYGAGSLNPADVSNVLRVVELEAGGEPLETDEIYVIDCNIDDINPQAFEHIFERLFEAGAYDAFLTSIYMKKTRPGFLLTVLSKSENLGKISHLILRETTTTGVRFYPVRRLKLSRSIKELVYRGRKVRVKVIELAAGAFRVAPEYEDCKRLARATKIPILKIYNEIKMKAGLKWRSRG